MVLEHFNLQRMPFNSAPDSSLLVNVPAMKEVIQRTRTCIGTGSGIAVVVGAPGCGKSLLLEKIAADYQHEFHVVHLICPRLKSRLELLQHILFQLNQPFKGSSEGELRLQLIDFLQPSESCPKGMLLLVDEAHLLPASLIEELRQITNIVRHGEPRVRLVLAGGLALEERLNHPRLDAFVQRITGRMYLNHLTRDETYLFVVSQLQLCGRDGREIFEPSGLEAVFKISEGVPRVINQVCQHVMVEAAEQGWTTIDSDCVQRTWSELQCLPYSPPSESTPDAGPTAAVVEFGSLDESIPTEAPRDVDSNHETSEKADAQDTPPLNPKELSFDDFQPAEGTGLTHPTEQQPNETSDSVREQVPGELPSQRTVDSLLEELERLDESVGADTPPSGRTEQPGGQLAGPSDEEAKGGEARICGLPTDTQQADPHQVESEQAESEQAESEQAEIRQPETQPDVSAGIQTDSPGVFQHEPITVDLFGEDFADEETVHDHYASLASETNRLSIELNREDLNILSSQGQEIGSEFSAISWEEGAPAPNSPADVEEECDTNDTNDTNTNIEDQTDDRPTPRIEPNPAVETSSDFGEEAFSADSHETGEQSMPEDEGEAQAMSPLSVEYPISDHASYQIHSSDESLDAPISEPEHSTNDHSESPSTTDDRDIILISQVDNIPTPEKEPEAPEPDELEEPSTGRGVRVELQALFDQLRGLDKNS